MRKGLICLAAVLALAGSGAAVAAQSGQSQYGSSKPTAQDKAVRKAFLRAFSKALKKEHLGKKLTHCIVGEIQKTITLGDIHKLEQGTVPRDLNKKGRRAGRVCAKRVG